MADTLYPALLFMIIFIGTNSVYHYKTLNKGGNEGGDENINDPRIIWVI